MAINRRSEEIWAAELDRSIEMMGDYDINSGSPLDVYVYQLKQDFSIKGIPEKLVPHLILSAIDVDFAVLEQKIVNNSDDGKLYVFGAPHWVIPIQTQFFDSGSDGAMTQWRRNCERLRVGVLAENREIARLEVSGWSFWGGVISRTFQMAVNNPTVINLSIQFLVQGFDNDASVTGTRHGGDEEAIPGVLSAKGLAMLGPVLGEEGDERSLYNSSFMNWLVW